MTQGETKGLTAGAAQVRVHADGSPPPKAFGHALHLLTEWASLDMLCVATIMIQDQFPYLSESFSEDFGYDLKSKLGPKLTLELDLKAGLYLCLFGSLLASANATLVLHRHFPHAFPAGTAAPKVAPEKEFL